MKLTKAIIRQKMNAYDCMSDKKNNPEKHSVIVTDDLKAKELLLWLTKQRLIHSDIVNPYRDYSGSSHLIEVYFSQLEYLNKTNN